jgi:hypothetical protein
MNMPYCSVYTSRHVGTNDTKDIRGGSLIGSSVPSMSRGGRRCYVIKPIVFLQRGKLPLIYLSY